MSRLLIEQPRRRVFIEDSEPLPDHIEIQVRLAQMRMNDASAFQACAALNSRSVRQHAGVQEYPDRRKQPTTGHRYLSGTAVSGTEQYAYARYLMGIDDYWLGLANRRINERIDYKIDKMVIP